MTFKDKARHEVKAVTIAALYFGCWIAALLLIKQIVLVEYHIAFHHYSMAFVGALILSKVVILLEHVPLGPWVRARPAWVEIVLRTVLYAAGVLVVMGLEKGLEGRREHGGFASAVMAAVHGTDSHHLWANSICIAGALLFYNVLALVRLHVGDDRLFRMFLRPAPEPVPSHPSTE